MKYAVFVPGTEDEDSASGEFSLPFIGFSLQSSSWLDEFKEIERKNSNYNCVLFHDT